MSGRPDPCSAGVRARDQILGQVPEAVDTLRGVHAEVLARLGLGVVPDFMAVADIGRERLIWVLSDWCLPGGGITAVFASSRLRPTSVCAFVAMLA